MRKKERGYKGMRDYGLFILKKNKECDLDTFDFVRNRIHTITGGNYNSEVQDRAENYDYLRVEIIESGYNQAKGFHRAMK